MLQSLETVDAGASGLSICKCLIMSRPLQDLALSDIHATLLSRLARFTIAYPADLPTSLLKVRQVTLYERTRYVPPVGMVIWSTQVFPMVNRSWALSIFSDMSPFLLIICPLVDYA